MKSRQRRSFSAEMKARIALEAIKEQKTIQEIASHYGVHPSQVTSIGCSTTELPRLINHLRIVPRAANSTLRFRCVFGDFHHRLM